VFGLSKSIDKEMPELMITKSGLSENLNFILEKSDWFYTLER
jgi:hypothetical protein